MPMLNAHQEWIDGLAHAAAQRARVPRVRLNWLRQRRMVGATGLSAGRRALQIWASPWRCACAQAVEPADPLVKSNDLQKKTHP